MYLENEWYSLSAKEEIKSEDAVEGLDVSLLQNDLLDPFWGLWIRRQIRELILSEASGDWENWNGEYIRT